MEIARTGTARGVLIARDIPLRNILEIMVSLSKQKQNGRAVDFPKMSFEAKDSKSDRDVVK